MATRQAVKSLAKSSTEIAANAATEKARKLASKAALKAALPVPKAKTARKPKAATVVPQVITTDALEAKRATEAANAIASLRVDFDSYEGQLRNPDDTFTTFEQYLAQQGFTEAGAPRAPSAVAKPGSYQGPMLALRAAAKTYVVGKNGNPHCNDMVAEQLAQLTREQTVKALGELLFAAGVTTSTNPYITLNPGQQSMNLRNKLRGALKAGTVTFAAVEAAVADALTKA